jgi:hypothetical protein
MEEKKGFFSRIFNRDTQGAVASGKFHEERKQDLLDHAAPGRDLGAMDTTDNFSGRQRFDDGNNISLENADALQEGISDYASGKEITGQDNILPCDLVGRPRDPKTGVSSKRTWDR